jgi:hypothetical protein
LSQVLGIPFVRFEVRTCRGLGVIEGNSVDDEGVDIAGGIGSNCWGQWGGLVVCRFDRMKRTVDKGRDCEVLACVDFKGQHGQPGSRTGSRKGGRRAR